MFIAGPSWASRGRGSGFEQCLVTKASDSELDFFHLFALLSQGMWSSPSAKPAICHEHFDMDSFLPVNHPTPSHLVTPLHLALTILPPSSTLPFASPFSLLAPMAFYAFSAPTSFFLAFRLPTLKDSSLDLSPWHFAHNSCFPSSQKLCSEVEGFNMVQHGSTTFCSLIIAAVVAAECHWITMHWRCWCGKWSQWSNETFRFHNLAHRICFLPVLIAGPSWASRGRGSGFEQCLVTKASGSKLDFFHVFFLL